MRQVVQLLAFLCACLIAVPAEAVLVHIYVMMGQSNMVGIGALPGVADTTSTSIQDWIGGPTWRVAFVEPSGGQGANHSSFYGPDQQFALRITNTDHPGEQVGIINCGVGGSYICQWMPGKTSSWVTGQDCTPGGVHTDPATYYGACLNAVNVARAVLTTQGNTSIVDALVWDQGESDSVTADAVLYQSRLTTLIAQLRGDYGVNMPFVFGETGNCNVPECPASSLPGNINCPDLTDLRTGQFAVASSVLGAGVPGGGVARTCIFNTEALSTACPDPFGRGSVHFTTPSYRVLGAGLADCVDLALTGGTPTVSPSPTVTRTPTPTVTPTSCRTCVPFSCPGGTVCCNPTFTPTP